MSEAGDVVATAAAAAATGETTGAADTQNAANGIDPALNRQSYLAKLFEARRKTELSRKATRNIAQVLKDQMQQQEQMGPQSQRRLSQKKRGCRLAARNKKNKTYQHFGLNQPFEPLKHCQQCIEIDRFKTGDRNSYPHIKHHDHCYNKRGACGIAGNPRSAEEIREDEELHESNRLKGKTTFNSVKRGAESFWLPKKKRKLTKKKDNGNDNMNTKKIDYCLEPEAFLKGVNKTLADQAWRDKHIKKRTACPWAMLAFAKYVGDETVTKKETASYFDGLTITVPPADGVCDNPQYHSTVGNKLLYVNWEVIHGIKATCPCCGDDLKNLRGHWSHNQVLHPMFGLDGPPSWCVVMPMQCTNRDCRKQFNSNDGGVLSMLPDYAALSYPVDSKYAIPKAKSHLARSITDVMDHPMVTCTGGDVFSKLIYNAINRSHMEKVRSYYSYQGNGTKKKYIDLKTEYIVHCPPGGKTVREAYNKASKSNDVHWGVSDHDRHNREIQGTSTEDMFVHDHTFETCKNYYQRKYAGIEALLSTCTGAGETPGAYLVSSTKRGDMSHALTQLSNRPWFNPKIRHSDTFPHNKVYFNTTFGREIEGRLGLFHYEQRLTKTLDERNKNYGKGYKALLDCIWEYDRDDLSKLYGALREGTLGDGGLSNGEITALQFRSGFGKSYGKYLRKRILPSNVICERLDKWWEDYGKDNRSSCAECGRENFVGGIPLCSKATKKAIGFAKENSKYIQDPLELQHMYVEIRASPRSNHGLSEHLSLRGESNLESFHALLAHFANCGMESTLADNLNLTGTARHNLKMRHKLRLAQTPMEDRGKEPASWETEVDYFNHSELNYVNELAKERGISTENLPFPEAEQLVEDTGERFFSEHFDWLQNHKSQNINWIDDNDMCQCSKCVAVLREREVQQQQQQQQQEPPVAQATNLGTAPPPVPPMQANPPVRPTNTNPPPPPVPPTQTNPPPPPVPPTQTNPPVRPTNTNPTAPPTNANVVATAAQAPHNKFREAARATAARARANTAALKAQQLKQNQQQLRQQQQQIQLQQRQQHDLMLQQRMQVQPQLQPILPSNAYQNPCGLGFGFGCQQNRNHTQQYNNPGYISEEYDPNDYDSDDSDNCCPKIVERNSRIKRSGRKPHNRKCKNHNSNKKKGEI